MLNWIKTFWYWIVIVVLVALAVFLLAHMVVNVNMQQQQTQTVSTDIYNVNENVNLVVSTAEAQYGERIGYHFTIVKFEDFTNRILPTLTGFQQLYMKLSCVGNEVYVGVPTFNKNIARVSVTNTSTNYQSNSKEVKPLSFLWK